MYAYLTCTISCSQTRATAREHFPPARARQRVPYTLGKLLQQNERNLPAHARLPVIKGADENMHVRSLRTANKHLLEVVTLR